MKSPTIEDTMKAHNVNRDEPMEENYGHMKIRLNELLKEKGSRKISCHISPA